MKQKPKVKIVSLTYKVGNKVQTVKPANIEKEDDVNQTNLIPHQSEHASSNDFQCINGQLYIKVCFGGDCHWAPLGRSCE